VDGFSYEWSQSATTTPDNIKDVEETTTSATSSALANANNWYFHLRTRDNAGNWTSTVHYGPFYIDTTAPTISTLTSSTHPSESTWYSNDDPAFSWSASDTSGITGYSYILDQTASTTPDNTSEGTGTTTSYTDKANGTWYFHIRAKDGAGNWGSTTHKTVKIDVSAPTVDLTAPTDGASVSGVVDVTATASDTPSGVSKVEFYVDSDKKSEDTTSPYSYSWDASTLSGSHTVAVKSYDQAGNASSLHTHTVNVIPTDNTAPAAPINLTANPSVWTNNNSFTVNWTNPTDPSGIAKAYYKLDEVPASKTDGTPVEGSGINSISGITVSGSANHTIYVWLEDGVGNANHNNRSSTSLKYDNTSPTTAVSAPANGSTVSGTISITATATDSHSGVARVEFYVDGSYKDQDPSSPYEYPWDTTGLTDGTWHDIKAKAFDNAGNGQESTTISVKVDNSVPSVSSTNPTSGETGVAIDTNITATFSKDMNASTITTTTFTLVKTQGGVPVSGNVTYDVGTKTAIFNPSSDLEYGVEYTATLKTGIQDTLGNPLTSTYTWSFTAYNPYDVNKDSLVNINDLVTIATAFGSQSGDPNWNADADVNTDGQINIFDLVLVAKRINP